MAHRSRNPGQTRIWLGCAEPARTLPKHGLVLRDHADCKVKVLDPVDPGPFDGDTAALREHVRTLIVEEKQRMERAAAGLSGPDRSVG